MTDVFKDLHDMHVHYGFHEKIAHFDEPARAKLLEFRYKFLQEEMKEIADNIDNPEEVVDGLIDLVVVAVGTLDLFGIDGHKAWNNVHVANMSKEVGIKATRPNPLGLPDLIKPEGWTAPSHEGNHGTLPTVKSETQSTS